MQVMQKNLEVLLGTSVSYSQFLLIKLVIIFLRFYGVAHMLISGSVSQFTLYGFLKGNKPDFHVAMPPEKARPFYESVVEKFRKAYNSDAVKGKPIFCLASWFCPCVICL